MRKNKVNEQFRRKMNQDVNGNGILFWKEVKYMEEKWKIAAE